LDTPPFLSFGFADYANLAWTALNGFVNGEGDHDNSLKNDFAWASIHEYSASTMTAPPRRPDRFHRGA
jgi:hypothetical protein